MIEFGASSLLSINKNTLNKMQKWSLLITLFNNAVDGLMYIRIADIPEKAKPLWKNFRQN
jgi:hypothetical protein